MGVNNLDQLRYKGGTFGVVWNHRLTVGTTPDYIAVPTISTSAGARPHWFEVHALTSSATGGVVRDGVRWSFAPNPNVNYSFVPAGNIVPYPLSPNAGNTLGVRAENNTIAFDVNWYGAGTGD